MASWFEANRRRLEVLGFLAAYKEGPADRAKRSAWIDLDLSSKACRVIVWETGEGDIETGSVDSEKVQTLHKELRSSAELKETLDEVVNDLMQSDQDSSRSA